MHIQQLPYEVKKNGIYVRHLASMFRQSGELFAYSIVM